VTSRSPLDIVCNVRSLIHLDELSHLELLDNERAFDKWSLLLYNLRTVSWYAGFLEHV